MEHAYTEDQRMLDDAVVRYLQGEYPAPAGRAELAIDTAPTALPHWQAFADMGLSGLGLPEQAGGMQADLMSLCIVAQRFGEYLVVEPYDHIVLLGGQLLAGMPLGAQRDRLLRGLAQGDLAPVLAHAESGMDGAGHAPGCTAQPDGSGWRLNGRKRLVPFGAGAQQWLVTAQTDAGPALFLIERGAAGLQWRGTQGLDGRVYADLILSDCRVGTDAMLGRLGNALDTATDMACVALCADMLGAMRRLLRLTRDYVGERRQFGQTLGDFQVIRHRLVDMLLQFEVASAMTWAAAQSDAGMRARLASAAKVKCGQAARFISQQSIQLHGGMGMTDELDVGHYVKRLMVIEQTLGDTRHHLQRYLRHDAVLLHQDSHD